MTKEQLNAQIDALKKAGADTLQALLESNTSVEQLSLQLKTVSNVANKANKKLAVVLDLIKELTTNIAEPVIENNHDFTEAQFAAAKSNVTKLKLIKHMAEANV